MSGGGGGIIIIDVTKQTLSNPIVHGSLPAKSQTLIDPILAKDPSLWTAAEKKHLGTVFSWALQNLS
jgi:hypothetical protein